MTIEHTIGPRQTIDRALHPTLGEGRAVYGNGPACFMPDAGEPVPMRSIGLGGVSSVPRRSYLVARTLDGERIELETTDRPAGDHHQRRWHAAHGDGWLVMLGKKMDRACAMRFDPDDGKPFEMVVHVLHVGTPDYAARCEARSKRSRGGTYKAIEMTDEEKHWATYTLASGEVVAFRDATPTPEQAKPTTNEPSAPTASAPAQPSHGSFPPPNATRAEVDAWVAHTNRNMP